MGVIDARSRFTRKRFEAARAPGHTCRDCGKPATHMVFPPVDRRRRKPWPLPYGLCRQHAGETP